MNNIRIILTTLVTCLVLLVLTSAAQAQATHTWVSGVGDDTNSCSRTEPCRTFAGAILKTAAGGEILVLDPGNFGTVTITKSIAINGTLAGFPATSNGIVVSAAPTDKVIIRNILIEGGDTGLNGVRFLAGLQLTLDNVTISGFTARGVDMSLAASGKLFVKDTRITNVPTGFRCSTTAGQALCTLDNVNLDNMTTAFDAAASSFVTIKNSTISGHSTNGVIASGPNAIVNLENNAIVFNNGIAVNASVAGARIRISNNIIMNNSTGIAIAAGAFVETANNNRIEGNKASTAPNATITAQ